ncbi:MAG: hypothetical protein K6F11_01555 [Lachnospiraceae bacterium]|nr:hypothetical protein [Lachnospiraceae bacterium]
MVVDKKFYERLKLFWWVALGRSICSFIVGFSTQIVHKVLMDYADKDIEPSKSMYGFMLLLVRHAKTISYILLAIGTVYFVTMLLLRHYSRGLLIAAVTGISIEVLDFFQLHFYWSVHPKTTMENVLELMLFLGGLVCGIFYVVGMMKMTKPFSGKIAKLWEVELWLVIGGLAFRVVYAVLLVVVRNKVNTPAFVTVFEKIRTFYSNADFLYAILCLGLTVWMFKGKLGQQEPAGGEQVFFGATEE